MPTSRLPRDDTPGWQPRTSSLTGEEAYDVLPIQAAAHGRTTWLERLVPLKQDLARLALGAQGLQRLVQDLLCLGVGAALLHVREVGLVRLDLRRRRRVLR